MQPTMCSRCHKHVAVVFITKLEGDQSKNEGLCLKCAKELGIKPIDDMIQKMGITDEDLENLTSEMMSAFGGAEGMEGLMPQDREDGDEDDGRTATFPFLNQLFGAAAARGRRAQEGRRPPAGQERRQGAGAPREAEVSGELLHLPDPARPRRASWTRSSAGSEEIERVIQILNRRQKNNPCLIGEPGVGKTAIAEGLAQRIVDGGCALQAAGQGGLSAGPRRRWWPGTQFRGQFEQPDEGPHRGDQEAGQHHPGHRRGPQHRGRRRRRGQHERRQHPEARPVAGARFRSSAPPPSTSTASHIEKDSALERRFQPVTVNEPSIEDSVKILKGLRPLLRGVPRRRDLRRDAAVRRCC